MAVDIHEAVDKMNKHWEENIKLINNREVHIGRIVYDYVVISALFLSFRDKDENVIGTIRIAIIDEYDSKDNSIRLK